MKSGGLVDVKVENIDIDVGIDIGFLQGFRGWQSLINNYSSLQF